MNATVAKLLAFALPVLGSAVLWMPRADCATTREDPQPGSTCGHNNPTKETATQICASGDPHGDMNQAKANAKKALGDAIAGDVCPECTKDASAR